VGGGGARGEGGNTLVLYSQHFYVTLGS